MSIPEYLIEIFKFNVRDNKAVYGGLVLCVFFNFIFCVLLTHSHPQSVSGTLIPATWFIISCIVQLAVVAYCVFDGFGRLEYNNLFGVILNIYLIVIVTFSSLYFESCMYADLHDATFKRMKYGSQVAAKSNYCSDLRIIRLADERAFKGITARLWSSVDYPDSNLVSGSDYNYQNYLRGEDNSNQKELSLNQIEEISYATRNSPNPEKCLLRNIPNVYFNCLYFSIITITTVGYGDISPDNWYSKILCVLEVLAGHGIFFLILVTLFTK